MRDHEEQLPGDAPVSDGLCLCRTRGCRDVQVQASGVSLRRGAVQGPLSPRSPQPLLGGSWVVISRDISRITI